MSKTPQEFLQDYRREQILAAAQSEIAEKGYANALVDDIASRAGVSRSTVYQYFPSKEAILWDCVAQGRERLAVGWERQADPQASFESRLTGFIEVCLETVDENRQLFLATASPGPLSSLSDLDDTDMSALTKQFLAGLDGVVRPAIERGELPKALRPEAVRNAAILIVGGMLARCRVGCPPPARDAAVELSRFTAAGLKHY